MEDAEPSGARAEPSAGALPLVTIVTAVFNGAATLRDAIDSVKRQTYPRIEHIVIDACSRDGTVDILREQGGDLEYWVSEKDSGFGEAWNKGLNLSRGDIVAFLSHDDFLDPQAVELAVGALTKTDADLVYGYTKFEQAIGWYRDKPVLNTIDKLHCGIGFMYTACFQRVTAYEKVGAYDDTLRIAVDSEFLLRCIAAGLKFVQGANVTYMRRGGVSDRKWLVGYLEYLGQLRRHGLLRVSYTWAIARARLLNLLVNPLGQDVVGKLKGQAFFLLLGPLNALLHMVPGFTVRHALLRLAGVKIAARATVHRRLTLFHFGRLEIGSDSVINSGCYLDNRGGIRIGSNVSISHDTKIYTAGHDIDDDCFPLKLKQVVIQDDACIFSNSLIMPGVTVGAGSIVLAGAVVIRDVPPWSIVGGNPATVLRRRGIDQARYRHQYRYWLAH